MIWGRAEKISDADFFSLQNLGGRFMNLFSWEAFFLEKGLRKFFSRFSPPPPKSLMAEP